jgi:type I restriction enzyme S subunit
MNQTEYKESGAEWIGRIPRRWELKPAFSVLHELEDRNDRGQVNNVLSLSYGKIVRRDVESNFGLLPESFNTYQIVQNGDIVLRLLDLQNDHVSLRVGLVPEEGIVTSAYLAVRPKNGLDSRFAAYLLHAYDLKKVFYNFGGGCRQSMGFEDLRRLPVPFPLPVEQRRIAVYMDEATAKIDRLMSMRRRQMELLREQRAALIQQAVTFGLNPRAPLKDSGLPWLGQIPKHWRIIPVKYAARIKRGKFAHRPRTDPALYDGKHPFVQTGDVATADKFITTHTQTLNDVGYAVSVEFSAGTLLMAIAANIGDLAILGFDACVPDSIVGLFTRPGVETEFLYYELTCLKSWLHALAPENTQMNLNVDRFSPQKIAMPPPDEQREILAFIQRETAKLDGLHRSYERQLALLAEYRASMIHECVTGQRPV